MTGGNGQSLTRILRDEHIEAARFHNRPQHFTEGLVILDDQNRPHRFVGCSTGRRNIAPSVALPASRAAT